VKTIVEGDEEYLLFESTIEASFEGEYDKMLKKLRFSSGKRWT